MSSPNRSQLASLLDKVSDLYRSGIPGHLITHSPRPQAEMSESPMKLRLIVIGSKDSVSAEERALLDAIATNGLGLTENEYTKEFFENISEVFGEGSTSAPVTILFGVSEEISNAPGIVIATDRLSDLVADASRKKVLWREIQKRCPKKS